jgi:hypothetical protein
MIWVWLKGLLFSAVFAKVDLGRSSCLLLAGKLFGILKFVRFLLESKCCLEIFIDELFILEDILSVPNLLDSFGVTSFHYAA